MATSEVTRSFYRPGPVVGVGIDSSGRRDYSHAAYVLETIPSPKPGTLGIMLERFEGYIHTHLDDITLQKYEMLLWIIDQRKRELDKVVEAQGEIPAASDGNWLTARDMPIIDAADMLLTIITEQIKYNNTALGIQLKKSHLELHHDLVEEALRSNNL